MKGGYLHSHAIQRKHVELKQMIQSHSVRDTELHWRAVILLLVELNSRKHGILSYPVLLEPRKPGLAVLVWILWGADWVLSTASYFGAKGENLMVLEDQARHVAQWLIRAKGLSEKKEHEREIRVPKTQER